MKQLFAIVILLGGVSIPAFAQTLSADDEVALKQTQALLNDGQKRSAVLGENPDAAALDQRIQKMTGSAATSDKIYQVSASILEDLVRQAQGDPKKLQEMIQKAQQDPEAFAKSLSGAQKDQIRSIANEVEGNNKKRP